MSRQGTDALDQPMPEKALQELFGQSRDRGRPGLPVMSLSMGRGLVPRNQDERRVETNLSDEQHCLVRAGELAYNMMRMWQGVCGLAEEDCLISPAYVVVRPLNGMDPKFSEYLLTYSDFSWWVYLTSSEAKIEFKPIEPRNPWVDAFSSEFGRQVLVVLS